MGSYFFVNWLHSSPSRLISRILKWIQRELSKFLTGILIRKPHIIFPNYGIFIVNLFTICFKYHYNINRAMPVIIIHTQTKHNEIYTRFKYYQ